MALIAWQRASQPETRTMAYATVTAQQAEIGSAPPMAWVPDGGRMLGADGRMPGMASPAEVAALETAQGKQVDVQLGMLLAKSGQARAKEAGSKTIGRGDPNDAFDRGVRI